MHKVRQVREEGCKLSVESLGRGDKGRRPREQARGTHVRGPVCACVCKAICAQFPLTSQSQAAPRPSVSWAVPVSAQWVPAEPSGNTGRASGLSQLSRTTG